MLRRTIAVALLIAAACVTAFAANTAYDRAAGMATGETSLGRGYDGADAAGTVKASYVPANRSFLGGDSPARRIGFGVAGAAVGAAVAGTLGRPIGALLGAVLGFGIALMLSKRLD